MKKEGHSADVINRRFLNFMLWYDSGHPDLSEYMAGVAHRAGLRIVHLAGLRELHDSRALEFYKRCRDEHGDEIVIWLGPDTQLLNELKIDEDGGFLFQLSQEAKKKVIRRMTEIYCKAMGAPCTAAAYFTLDAVCLKALKEACPEIICAMASCFEEGINVTHGHRYFNIEWINWNEGGPWYPWIPRSGNAIAPAGAGDDKIDLVCIPHLNRNLMNSFDARNDWNSSQPMDQMRGKSVFGGNIDYAKRLFQEYMKQAELNNGYAYYQFLEGQGPLISSAPHVFDEPASECKQVYEEYVGFLGEQVRAGNVINVSMTEFGKWFWDYCGAKTPATVAHWHDLCHGSKKEYVWCLNSQSRLLLAPERGGAILDWRPYSAGIEKHVGNDSPSLWDGSYPFVIQNHHRYGSMATGLFRHNGITLNLSDYPLQTASVANQKEGIAVSYKPVTLDFGQLSCEIEVTCRLDNEGVITIQYTLGAVSGGDGELEMCEYVRGTWGTTDLPESLEGLWLEAVRGNTREGFKYAYRGRLVQLDDANECRVYFPGEKIVVKLWSEDKECSGIVGETPLFQSFFEMALFRRLALQTGNSFTCRLSVVQEEFVPVAESRLARRRSDWSATNAALTMPWHPSGQPNPLRCPQCLLSDRETHLLLRGEQYYCQFCSFEGDKNMVLNLYQKMRKNL